VKATAEPKQASVLPGTAEKSLLAVGGKHVFEA